MNSVIEELFQSIGNQILDMVGDDVSQVLAYAEAEDGAVSVALFYAKSENKIPVFKFGGKELSDLFYSLWEEWGKQNTGEVWRGSAYCIRNGKPTLEMIYPDKFDERATENARRVAMLEKYFGSPQVDYSQA
ncbi:immunity protein YezG family protein [Chitinimonas sp. PSY-7]|uniref:immunity protein YezG family protein n=1 Tax=Chitinimonas sp. PSY-7 TaxID=3459088 RepID=UPI0040403AD0